MNAIVLAGGFGSRLKPLTDNCPKPMLPLANRPMLDYVVAQLYHYGITDVTFTLGYKAEQVYTFCSRYNQITAHFSTEEQPLGTAGGVKNASEFLDDVFIVISGDALNNVNLSEMIEKHLSSANDVTMTVTSVDNPSLYGVVNINETDKVISFVEKPATREYGNLVNTGIYVINKSVLSYVPSGVSFDFARNLFPTLLQTNKVGAYLHNGYWCDIGDKQSYFKANFYVRSGGFYPVLKNENILPSRENAGSLLGNNATTLGKVDDCIIGKNSHVASCARLKNCIVMENVTVTENYENAIIGTDFVEKVDFDLKAERFNLKNYENLVDNRA